MSQDTFLYLLLIAILGIPVCGVWWIDNAPWNG